MDPEIKHLLYLICGGVLVPATTYTARSVWEFLKNQKGPSKEEFKKLTDAMTRATSAWERQEQSVQRIFLFLKEISGEKWATHFENVKKEEKREQELKNGGIK